MPGTDPSNLASTIEFLLDQTPGESPVGTAPDGTELVEVVQGGVSVSLTLDELFTRLVGSHITWSDPTDGDLDIKAANRTTGEGGYVRIHAGNSADSRGGAIILSASDGDTDGGELQLNSGSSGPGGYGATVTLDGGASTGQGASVSLTAGDGYGTDKSGGDVVLTPGAKTGAGSNGLISLQADAIKGKAVTVANLPAAATAGNGARAFVTDATATTFASTVAGTGSNKVPVYSDGTNWKIG